MKLKSLFWGMTLILAATACQKNETDTNQEQNESSPMNAYMELKGASIGSNITSAGLDEINVGLETSGANFRVLMAEYITAAGSDEAGQTVYAHNVGNKQLDHDFVPNDVRREWSGVNPNEITYAIDQTGDAVPPFGGLTAAETDAAIERGFTTWRNADCSELGLVRNDDEGLDIGYVAFINGLGGSPFAVADVQLAGWRDINFAGGVLGVTFTFIFVDGGEPTDIDNNGKQDVAFREIYFDPSWNWADDGSTNIDVESVAVHEIGHGLSQAHFGKVSVNNHGELTASPRAVMNAYYASPFRELTGSDNGGHCSIWSTWPIH